MVRRVLFAAFAPLPVALRLMSRPLVGFGQDCPWVFPRAAFALMRAAGNIFFCRAVVVCPLNCFGGLLHDNAKRVPLLYDARAAIYFEHAIRVSFLCW